MASRLLLADGPLLLEVTVSTIFRIFRRRLGNEVDGGDVEELVTVAAVADGEPTSLPS